MTSTKTANSKGWFFVLNIVSELRRISMKFSHIDQFLRNSIFYAYRVCSRQIDSEASGSCRQEEDEDVGPLLEVGDHVATLVDLWAAVQPHEGVLAMRHVLLQQVDHSRHLRIDENSVAVGFESGEKSVEDEQFSGVKNKSFFVWNNIV